MDIVGCSCLGGTSHECQNESKTLLTQARLKGLLNDHFPELKLSDIVHAYVGAPFISTWNVGTIYPHPYQGDIKLPMYVTLPLASDGKYDFVVDWGDDSSNHITAFDQAEVRHVYAAAGEYDIQLNGIVDGFTFYIANGHKNQIIDISQWGCVRLEKKRGHQFAECDQLCMSASDAPDLTGVTSMDFMFAHALSFNGEVSQWNTGGVTNMNSMFACASSFNGDVSQWNTGSVTSMNGMFLRASSFNGDVSQWDTSSVTSMEYMFAYNSSFNGDVSQWNTGSVTHLRGMFAGASSFNGDVSQWDTGSVISMNSMFRGASSFSGDVSQWSTRNVTDMSYMFSYALSFNGDVRQWSTGSVTSMMGMFSSASSFNGDHIRGWDLSALTHDRAEVFRYYGH